MRSSLGAFEFEFEETIIFQDCDGEKFFKRKKKFPSSTKTRSHDNSSFTNFL